MGFLSEGLLYICYAFLMGTLIVQLVPATAKPNLRIPRQAVLWSIVGTMLLAFAPLLQIIMRFGPGIGYGKAISTVLFSFKEGKAYLLVFGLCLLLLLTFLLVKNALQDKKILYPSLLIVLCIIGTFGYVSHVGAIGGIGGAVIQFTHMLAMAVWTGILFSVAWFTAEARHWERFLKWFTPVSIACVVLILVSGLLTMTYTVPEYINSWILPYGQALLMKHLLFVPIIIFGFCNGFLIRSKMELKQGFAVIPWLKAETILILFVFLFTALMSQEAPPHAVAETLQYNDPSAVFMALHPEASVPLQWQFSFPAAALTVLALIVLAGMVYSFVNRRSRPGMTLLIGFVFVITAYGALMLSVQ
ncbi:CopD family protein [Paenibacillus sp. Marseille-Q4541]|uniref:copper resistance D family protein n=1 Tax=Paenibacillus sp. Marseille-Q4541 TaxID=2831522 RepID=UPI001BAAD5CC|nr:CopD family protein [Paenibacillus sp. Marseille-Q4541]